jgi:hypothetical protein
VLIIVLRERVDGGRSRTLQHHNAKHRQLLRHFSAQTLLFISIDLTARRRLPVSNVGEVICITCIYHAKAHYGQQRIQVCRHSKPPELPERLI